MTDEIDEVDVRAAQYLLAHQCESDEPARRGHCAWCNAYWTMEDMWNLLTPVGSDQRNDAPLRLARPLDIPLSGGK